jgi:hypothetical protein
VERLNFLLGLENAIYYAIDMKLMTVEEAPQPFTSVNQRTAVWQFFQAENGLFESPIPFEGRVGMLCVDFSV